MRRCPRRLGRTQTGRIAAPESDDPHQHATAARGPSEFGNRAHCHHRGRAFRFAGGSDAADPPTKEALRYRHALLDGFATLPARPLCTATAELVCSRIARKADYYGLLLRVTRDAAWEPWILFMLQGIEETASWTTAKIGSIRQLMAEAVEHVRTTTPKVYSRELVDLVFEQPYCRIANVVEAGIAGRQAASRYLQALVSSGLLREQESGREKLFVNSRLLTLLTAETDAVEPFRSAPQPR